MKIAAIVPVKTFSKAKTRLKLSTSKKNELCALMLEEVLATISQANLINKIIIVTKDKTALRISEKFNTICIRDDYETSVNNAVSLADDYILKQGFNASIVFPQDIPFMFAEDIEKLIKFQNSLEYVGVVPSRKFDGTNALLRKPVNLMKTHYDEDSYKLHLEVGKSKAQNSSLILLRRIMLDIDDQTDIEFIQTLNEKPQLCQQINQIWQETNL